MKSKKSHRHIQPCLEHEQHLHRSYKISIFGKDYGWYDNLVVSQYCKWIMIGSVVFLAAATVTLTALLIVLTRRQTNDSNGKRVKTTRFPLIVPSGVTYPKFWRSAHISRERFIKPPPPPEIEDPGSSIMVSHVVLVFSKNPRTPPCRAFFPNFWQKGVFYSGGSSDSGGSSIAGGGGS